MPNATATRPKSQSTRKTGAAGSATSPATRGAGLNGAQPYFSYAHVQREARIVPNKGAIGFSVQIRESSGEYGTLGQWKNADTLPLWALRPLLEQCGFLGGASGNVGSAPTTITQKADGATAVDMAADSKVSVGSA